MDNSSFSATKFYIPDVTPDLTPRPRLIEALSAGLEKKVVLLSAPAGFGKTALLAQWADSPHGRAEPLAWLSLDAEDNDPLRFWTLVTLALKGLPLSQNQAFASGSWRFDDSLALARSEQPPTWQVVLSALHSEIATVPQRFTLILDNYQEIQNDIVHQGLAHLIDHLPKQARIIIVTRKAPPLPLPRWRAKDLLADLRLAELRFTHSESAQVFNLNIHPPLSPDSVNLLSNHAEGWISGIRLAACALQDQNEPDSVSYIAEFTGKQGAVLEHLVDTVLQHLPESVRIFLLQTSVLNRFSADLADAVLVDAPPVHFEQAEGLDTTRGIIDFLLERHFFITPIDANHTWYSIQPFIRELLLARLQVVRPGLVFWLHRLAAEWFDANGLTAEAIEHARQGRDFELAADIMEQALRLAENWTNRDIISNLEWLKQLPEPSLTARPWLRLFTFRTRPRTEQLFEGDRFLAQLEQVIMQIPDSVQKAGRLLGLVFEARASLAVSSGESHLAVRCAVKASENLPQDYPLARSRAYLALGSAQAQLGEVAQATQSFSQAASIALSSGFRLMALEAAYNLAEIQFTHGQLDQVLHTVEKSAGLGIFAGQTVPQMGWMRLIQAKTAYHRNELAEAERLNREAIELLERGGIIHQLPQAYALLAFTLQTRGDIEGANVTIQVALKRAIESSAARDISLVNAYQARIWLAQHDYLRAFPWADKYRTTARPDYQRLFEDLTLVRCLLVNAQPEEALSRLDALLGQVKSSGQISRAIEILSLRAMILQSLGSQVKAMDILGQSLFLAEGEGIIRIFLNEGEAMQLMVLALREQMLGQVEMREGERFNRLLAFMGKILAAFPQIPAYRSQALPEGQSEPLNPREEAVLGMLAKGLSSREISQKLFLSANTLRAYTVSLFNKLGVNTRSDAVARARQSGLLPPGQEDQ